MIKSDEKQKRKLGFNMYLDYSLTLTTQDLP